MDWVTVSSSVMPLQSKNSERLFFSTALKRTTMADTGSFTCEFARRRRPFARSAAKTVKDSKIFVALWVGGVTSICFSCFRFGRILWEFLN